ncbi:putative flavonol reductase [Hymenopellis radicata]|nr:putative flavonol reductase [Hymenopellis radicata]
MPLSHGYPPGVDAIIHVASPVAGVVKDPKKDLLDPAIEGTLNILKAAHKAGITRIVLTSSIAAVADPTKGGETAHRQSFKCSCISHRFVRDYTYTAADWNPLTYEMASSGTLPGLGTYAVSKSVAEKSAWDFVKEHPEIKLTAINPTMLPGPPVQSSASEGALNDTSQMWYSLISGTTDVPETAVPIFVDVRDAARAHVLALKNDAVIGERVLLNGGSYTYYQIIKLLEQKRPELTSRLPSLEGVEDEPGPFARVDTAIAQKTLGMQFLSFEESFLDTIDSLVAIENAGKGPRM